MAVTPCVARNITLLSDADWLREQFVVLGRSTTSIAAEIGCSYNSVLYRMVQFGIQRRRCSAEGCDKELHSDNSTGYCRKHQRLGMSDDAKRLKYERDLSAARARRSSRPTCQAKGCFKLLYRTNITGYCGDHRGQSPIVQSYNRRYWDKNPGKKHEQYAKNREAVIARVSAYQRTHPEVHRAVLARRKVRVQADMDVLDRELSVAYRQAITGDPCFYCGAVVTHHVDHYAPLARGGTDHWWNLVRACQSCNQRKHTMSGDEFLLLSGKEVMLMQPYSEPLSANSGLRGTRVLVTKFPGTSSTKRSETSV